MGARKAYILHDKSLYGQGVAAVFRNAFERARRRGARLRGLRPKDADDYQTLMTSIADKGPDIVYVGATVENNAAKVLQDMRGVMGEEVIFLGPDGLQQPDVRRRRGRRRRGRLDHLRRLHPGQAARAGRPGRRLRHPRAPSASATTRRDAYAVYAYETAVVVIQAIDQVGEKDRAKILDTMFATEGFISLLGGTWSFTETGDTDSRDHRSGPGDRDGADHLPEGDRS